MAADCRLTPVRLGSWSPLGARHRLTGIHLALTVNILVSVIAVARIWTGLATAGGRHRRARRARANVAELAAGNFAVS